MPRTTTQRILNQQRHYSRHSKCLQHCDFLELHEIFDDMQHAQRWIYRTPLRFLAKNLQIVKPKIFLLKKSMASNEAVLEKAG